MANVNLSELQPHKFKAEDWRCSKRELWAALNRYWQEWDLDSCRLLAKCKNYAILLSPCGWTEKRIRHFLELSFHLVKGNAGIRHIRAIVSLLRKGGK